MDHMVTLHVHNTNYLNCIIIVTPIELTFMNVSYMVALTFMNVRAYIHECKPYAGHTFTKPLHSCLDTLHS